MKPPITQDDGTPFDPTVVAQLRVLLIALDDNERRAFQSANTDGIAGHPATHVTIVSGPGTGKSFLFLRRIKHWHEQDDDATITVSTFVKKLANDLIRDIKNDETLSDAHKERTNVYTLHRLARSFVEKNNGTKRWPFERHIRIIGQDWKTMIWDDVLLFHESVTMPWKEFEAAIQTDQLWSPKYERIATTYFLSANSTTRVVLLILLCEHVMQSLIIPRSLKSRTLSSTSTRTSTRQKSN